MKTQDFKTWLRALDDLTTLQSRILQEEIEKRALQKQVSKMLETPHQQIECPHCKSNKLIRWGKRSDMQRYMCKKCNKTFNSLTGTPLARLRRKGHWLNYANCLKEGLTVRQSAAICDVHPNTAFRWRHRFLENTKEIKAESLEGIVEVNDMFLPKSEKGKRKLEKTIRTKRGIDYGSEKICVFVGRDRNRNTIDALFENLNVNNIGKVLQNRLGKDILLCSDNRQLYRKYTKENKIRHGYIHLSKGETIKKDIVHIQNVENYQNHLKLWILGHFRGVATRYLNNYLGWHRELDELKTRLTPQTILLRAKQGGNYQHLP